MHHSQNQNSPVKQNSGQHKSGQHVAVIGAGITGVTTCYALLKRGYNVTVFDRNRYAAMQTSFANGGQLSASNAEVWTQTSTILKGLKWMLRKDAPLLVNPSPSWHKYSWMAEFVGNIPQYKNNTVETTRLAVAAREHLYRWAADENIDFDHETRGILHFHTDKKGFDHASRVNKLLAEGGLERFAVTPDEMRAIEPNLVGDFYGGFYTPSDATGDIHKYTRGLAEACMKLGAQFHFDAKVTSVASDASGARVEFNAAGSANSETLSCDAMVICAGVGSRQFAAQLGDRVNIYPVKGYSITVALDDQSSKDAAPWVSLLDDDAKIVTSRLGHDRFRVAGTAEFNGVNMDIRDDRIQPLTQWVRRYFPGVNTDKVVPWAGLRPMMPNMMPRVGAGKQARVFYNTGHGHLGWTLSAATAELLGDAVLAGLPPKLTPGIAAGGARGVQPQPVLDQVG